MTKYTITLFLSFGSLSGLTQQNKEMAIRNMDRHNAETLVKKDTTELKRYLAKDFLLNGSNNKVSFGDERIISAIKNGRFRYKQFDVVTDTIYFISENTAISMGSETAVFENEDPLNELVQKRRYTNIWIREKDGWKLKSRHSSLVCN